MRWSGKPCFWLRYRRTASARSRPSSSLYFSEPDVVGVPLDLDVDVLVLRLDLPGELVDGRLALGREVGGVEAELHLVVREHGLVEELALGELARLLGAAQRVLGGLRDVADLLVMGVEAGLGLLDLALHVVHPGVDGAGLLLDVFLGRAAGVPTRAASERATMQSFVFMVRSPLTRGPLRLTAGSGFPVRVNPPPGAPRGAFPCSRAGIRRCGGSCPCP